jgi:cell division protein FtsB
LISDSGSGYRMIMASFYSFFRALLIILLLLLAAVVAPLKVFDPKGFERVERLRAELMELNEANARLKRENETLRFEIQSFHENPDFIEKVARDELGMVGPDEIVFQFPSKYQ